MSAKDKYNECIDTAWLIASAVDTHTQERDKIMMVAANGVVEFYKDKSRATYPDKYSDSQYVAAAMCAIDEGDIERALTILTYYFCGLPPNATAYNYYKRAVAIMLGEEESV